MAGVRKLSYAWKKDEYREKPKVFKQRFQWRLHTPIDERLNKYIAANIALAQKVGIDPKLVRSVNSFQLQFYEYRVKKLSVDREFENWEITVTR